MLMKILVVGDATSQAEFKAKFKDYPDTIYKNSQNLADEDLLGVDLVFDFNTQDFDHYSHYQGKPSLTVFANTILTSLKEHIQLIPETKLIGFNGLPSMFDRPQLELTGDPSIIQSTCEQLGTEYEVVHDRVGMVTPRVICMIINEAFYTTQEGTASTQDIDLGMKLGTRYPAGPFEMCQAIGIHHVYNVLDALYKDTRDERYKICPALKSAYLQSP